MKPKQCHRWWQIGVHSWLPDGMNIFIPKMSIFGSLGTENFGIFL
jgi:hypothetical protein